MGAADSNLSSIVPGFDYVVAVTEQSVNAALAQYLYYSNLPVVNLCYVFASATSNNLVQTDYDTFVQTYLDPFQFTDTPPEDQMQTLVNANFAFAIRAQLGSPSVSPLPSILTLNAGQSNVNYTLMFSTFIMVELQYGTRGNPNTWMYQSQPTDAAWTFSGPVNLNFDTSAFESLPTAIQKLLEGLGGATFSIQQLYYDLNSSQLEQSFETSLQSTDALYDFMTGAFVNTYWKALGGNEVLGYGANQTSSTTASSLAVTSMNFFVPDVNTTGNPLTLNYLCATNGDTLPGTSSAGFGWDWIDSGDAKQYDGVAALNRNTFVGYLNNALYDYVSSNCSSVSVRMSDKSVSLELIPGQTPTVERPAGDTLLYYYYSSKGGSRGGLDADHANMSSSFALSVTVSGNLMVIVQRLVVWCDIRIVASEAQGYLVDKMITDTYSFQVDGSGNLVVAEPSTIPIVNPADPSGPELPPTSVTVDDSQTPSANGFLNFLTVDQLNKIAMSQAGWAQACVGANVTDIPAAAVQFFVFPGGGAFSFADVQFSNNQDLVAHITYNASST